MAKEYDNKICPQCKNEVVAYDPTKRGYNGDWFHFDCYQTFIKAEQERLSKAAVTKPAEISHGFLIVCGYCDGCGYQWNGEFFIPPAELKENLYEAIKNHHGEKVPNCPKRKLIVGYTNCIYE